MKQTLHEIQNAYSHFAILTIFDNFCRFWKFWALLESWRFLAILSDKFFLMKQTLHEIHNAYSHFASLVDN